MFALPIATLQAPLAHEIVVSEFLVTPPVNDGGRRPFRPDEVFARYLLAARAVAPSPDDGFENESGAKLGWSAAKAGADGRIEGEIGYAYATLALAAPRVMLAELRGAARLYVNGLGYAGDLYGYGFGGVPVALEQGRNDLFVSGVRGGFSLKLVEPAAPVVVDLTDVTRPDLVIGADFTRNKPSLGVRVSNATQAPVSVQFVELLGDPPEVRPVSSWTEPVRLQALETAQLALPLWGFTRLEGEARTVPYRFALECAGKRWPYTIELDVRAADAARRITFTSTIDGSIQGAAWMPPSDATNHDPKFVLTLHGAGVDAWGHVSAYSPKPEFLIVAPTGRRPFGFDWQDWGRLDAYEALSASVRAFGGAPAVPMPMPRALCCDVRVYLSGHSMGGHGTWHMAANDPDRFLALAPSAGWIGFDSYGSGKRSGALSSIWRAADTSDTRALLGNLRQLPAFILHGKDDDNVPVSEAQTMLTALQAGGADVAAHFEAGAGHWWDRDARTGADCVDWPAIFALFRSTEPRAEAFLDFDWRSVDPGVDSMHGPIEVLQPLDYGEPFSIVVHAVENAPDELVTQNVRKLRILGAGWGRGEAPWRLGNLHLDPARVPFGSTLVLEEGLWRVVDPEQRESGVQKSPELSGPFKRAFDRRFVLVYGTRGDETEDRELQARARCDAQTWWYRASGRAEFVSDVEFLERLASDLGRNVILYGNADTNAAWVPLLGTGGSLEVHRGKLVLGDQHWTGPRLAALFVRPRIDASTGAATALVGVCADTGVAGTRLGYALAPFTSGVGLPDFTLLDAGLLYRGDGGVLAAGWFDRRWHLASLAYKSWGPRQLHGGSRVQAR